MEHPGTSNKKNSALDASLCHCTGRIVPKTAALLRLDGHEHITFGNQMLEFSASMSQDLL